jgi:hypothetical protein
MIGREMGVAFGCELTRKPEWDRRATSIWQHLNEGKVPMFGAAHLLHRSLLDFTRLQSLANLPESDVRRRGIVYAFSGARPAAMSLPGVKTVALDLTAIFTLALLGLLPVAIGACRAIDSWRPPFRPLARIQRAGGQGRGRKDARIPRHSSRRDSSRSP